MRVASLDHLVGAPDQRVGNVEAERLGGPEIDHQLVFGRRLYRHITWFFPLENAINVFCRATEWVDPIRAVGNQAAGDDKLTRAVDGGQLVPRRERYNRVTTSCHCRGGCYD